MLLTIAITGDSVGREIEDEFTRKAKESGLTEEEARSGFNQNMMSTGMLSEYPKEFAREHNRRWLVSAYEAGDVVLHKAHAVRRYSASFHHSNGLDELRKLFDG